MNSILELSVAVRSGCWCITPEGHAGLVAMTNAMASHGVPATAAAAAPRRAAPAAEGGQAVIGVTGFIEQRPGLLTMLGMGTACSDVHQALRAALEDKRVQRVVLAFDTPGGSVFGVQELADVIFAARSKKPVLGVVEGMCGSAGYWLASQCGKLFASPSSEVGSIGAYVGHVDESRALDRQGLSVTLVSAGKYKVEGASSAPLSGEAQAHLQDRVNTYYETFAGHVARGRGVPISRVFNGMGQGRMLGAVDAVCQGMIDATSTLHEVLTGRAGMSGGTMARARSSQWRAVQATIADVSLPAATRAARLLKLQADIARAS